jgi:hypothetical protein
LLWFGKSGEVSFDLNINLMKTITLSALLLVVTISLSSFVISNNVTNGTNVVAKGPGMLRVHRQGKAINLTWSNSANAVAYRLERGDGEFFDEMTTVENTGARSNSYKDFDYFPGTIYYRVVCLNADGSEECSNTEVIKIMQR